MKAHNLAGLRFGKLCVYERAGSNGLRCALWACVCDCGRMVVVTGHNLKRGATRACGQHRNAHAGLSAEERYTYHSWRAMQARCMDKSHKWYKHYGARGISIYFDWLGAGGFANFLRDVGRRSDGKTLDRIDSDGNYEPGNVKWSTAREQRANQRRMKGIQPWTSKNLRSKNP